MQYVKFLSKTINETPNLVETVARDAYEFEKITCVSGMSFPDPCPLHARLFYEENFVTLCVPPTVIPKCVPPVCDFCSTSTRSSGSCPQCV